MNIRTINSVLDLRNGKEIIASDFFTKPIDEIFQLRYEIETNIREKQPRFVCYFCRKAIKIRGKPDSKRILHFAHLKDSDDCPQKTDSKYSKEELLRIKYNGAKESDLHIELKLFIANSLIANKKGSKGIEFVEIEHINKHQAIPKIWKKPDVSSIFQGKSVVFDLQLSTTFLSVINSRQEFYKENQTFIIWVFNVFETDDDRRKFTQSDVFYSNNRNGFELDEVAKEKSIQEGDLILKCNYQKPKIKYSGIHYDWEVEYVKLADLTFNTGTYKVYYFDVAEAYEKLKYELEICQSRLIQIILNGEDSQISDLLLNGYKVSNLEKKYIVQLFNTHIKPIDVIERWTTEYRIIWTTLCLKFDDPSLLKSFVENFSLRKTITDVLSLKLNKIIAYAFKKQIQIAHRLIDTRPEHLDIYLNAISKYQTSLLKEQDASFKFRSKVDKVKNSGQKQSSESLVVVKIFPELIKYSNLR